MWLSLWTRIQEGGGRWEGCEEGRDVQIEGRLGMAGGWSLLKATRSRQRLQKACWGSQGVVLLPGS